ncbi:uncharacterized protein RAG0_07223 [Rhynchosporium agropyri]|uniref:beta-glucosidase n=1 Tax=Rhynchosporium agropyri TaxID=914238 RepID=A0A1E1KKF6_9HELO|nr:uncharacterized protein RAG0_07223 [Rhynchosporium agropyri]
MNDRGLCLGAEFRAKGAHIALVPVSGPVGRSGLAGCGWEGFSPDPYLTGVAMEDAISGMQKNCVQAVAKRHQLLPNYEIVKCWHICRLDRKRAGDSDKPLGFGPMGNTIEAVSSNIDER